MKLQEIRVMKLVNINKNGKTCTRGSASVETYRMKEGFLFNNMVVQTQVRLSQRNENKI